MLYCLLSEKCNCERNLKVQGIDGEVKKTPDMPLNIEAVGKGHAFPGDMHRSSISVDKTDWITTGKMYPNFIGICYNGVLASMGR